jgi:hypothetical protein
MKKIILFAAVISAFSFASCKKDRACTCTGTSSTTVTETTDWETSPTETTTNTYGGSGTAITTYNDAKKKDAKKACINETSKEEDVETDSGNTYNFDSGTWEDYTTTTTTTSDYSTDCSLK